MFVFDVCDAEQVTDGVKNEHLFAPKDYFKQQLQHQIDSYYECIYICVCMCVCACVFINMHV